MNNIRQYINDFYDQLEVYEDLFKGHSYKAYMHQAVLLFLDNETKETAFGVYQAFFDSYRITLKGASNPFIDLLDVLRSYEENAATLINKQRDHYVHSVNVFILGICIYTQNERYRQAFEQTVLDKTAYAFSYDTKHEEFYYRWGIASLFHDVGYPVEIIGKQISKFLDFATQVDQSPSIKSHLEFENFSELNQIAEVMPKKTFTQSYDNRYESCVYLDLLKPIDLLAHKLHLSLDVNLAEVKKALDDFVQIMAKGGFIDHGYYSAIIVLRWYGYLIQSCNYRPDYFFYPVLDSASAILLHNYYRNVLMKAPFNLRQMKPTEHPIAYLLILCDELQEWNRQAYGIVDRTKTQAEEALVVITDRRMNVNYLTHKGALPDDFAQAKEKLLNETLNLKQIFADGLAVSCEELAKLNLISQAIKPEAHVSARPLAENLEKLAIAIHELFNQRQLLRHPEQALAYPRFSDLPDSLKYSNLRQARSIVDKLSILNLEMRPAGSDGIRLAAIAPDDIERLACYEHEEWVNERQSTGWTYGAVKNVEQKISPYLKPYDELSEEIKELDRDTIRNIPELLTMIGMDIYRR